MTSNTQGIAIALRAMYETLAISVPTVVDGALSRMTLERGNARLMRWSSRLLEQADVELSVSGRERFEPGKAYVVMSNHQSHYDVPILFQSFPGTVRMVAKTELYKVPIFGPAMTAAGFIEIDRSNRERAIASLRVARERLARGISVWIAPEGTRSRTGDLLPFKKGGFMLALETQLPIVPVGIYGSRDILPAEGRVVQRGARVHVAFQSPIVPPGEDATSAQRDQLMADVRVAIERGVHEARSSLATGGPAR